MISRYVFFFFVFFLLFFFQIPFAYKLFLYTLLLMCIIDGIQIKYDYTYTNIKPV